MADKPGVGNIFRSPLISVLAFILVLLVGGFAANFYLVNANISRRDTYLQYANQLKVLSQQIAKDATAAAEGQKGAFDVLAGSRTQFDTNPRR